MAVQPANRLKFSFQSKHSSAEISQFLAETDNKDLFFSLSYWDIASVGSTARDLLEYAGVKHENITPTDAEWSAGEVPTAFSVLPCLKVKGPNGMEFNMAESAVIDTFLAERFGLLGNNAWEAMTIRTFYTNMQYLRERTFSETLSVKSSEKKKARDQFLSQSLRKFLEDHEFHLQENGCNGHYVGDKLSLADLHLNNIIHFYSTVPWAKMALDEFKKYEAVWKVKETVDRVTELYEWRASKEFKGYEKGSHDHYAQCAVPEDDLAEK
ncbi:hypothetical protein K457DRAFT_137848 [Linnemannia elongata AG-77]|uniref:Glutathione S-transferase n=1 Tax=Linnemannia elongata AG-77 TaxID=1314771 RepID=A0A197JVL1_9FUNG|nr:hypothetical protein K457DRAFT_137848 [Linnemannia elongata AG-77]